MRGRAHNPPPYQAILGPGPLVCKAGGYFGTPFKALRGVTQGGPLSPGIFILMVDAVIREWLRQVRGAEVAADGIGSQIRALLAAFYADDGLVQSRDPAFLQYAFDILVGLFGRVGLRTNTTKTEAMACVPGRICTASPMRPTQIGWRDMKIDGRGRCAGQTATSAGWN